MNIAANTVQPQGTPRGLLTRYPLLILGPLHVLWHLPYFFIPEWGTHGTRFLKLAPTCYPGSLLPLSTRGYSTVHRAACFFLFWRTHPLTHSIQANPFSRPSYAVQVTSRS